MSIFEPSRSPWTGRMLSILRPVAFILSGEMAVAYFQGHYPMSFWPSINMGTPAILYCFIFLYFVFAGAGPWSLDAKIARSKGGNPY